MTCKHGNHSMHCGWCEDQARITELEAHAQGLRERIAELEAQLASAQEMNRKLVPRVPVANSRPLSEIVAEFENSSPENKARLLAARESVLEAQRQWQPIETAPKDVGTVVREHTKPSAIYRPEAALRAHTIERAHGIEPNTTTKD